jgi:hypothetical protein
VNFLELACKLNFGLPWIPEFPVLLYKLTCWDEAGSPEGGFSIAVDSN